MSLNPKFKYATASGTTVTLTLDNAPGFGGGRGPGVIVIDWISGSHLTSDASGVSKISVVIDTAATEVWAVQYTNSATASKPTAFHYPFPNNGPRIAVPAADTVSVSIGTTNGGAGYLSVGYHYEVV